MDRRGDLAASLRSVTAAGPQEQEALERITALLGGDGDPFDRDSMAPGHVTASAFVLHPDGGRLLLILHRKLGRWLQPGGHVDPGDASVWEAAVREVSEETGLVATLVGEGPFDVDVHRVGHDGTEHEHFDIRYLVVGSGDPTAGDGVDAVRWATLDEFDGMEDSLRRPARKALGSP
ncbi:MAG: NUDIX hydrolase [Actinobacteria bacterium]|nr:NUDIX hydrolase [Actinomycetota bacterium]MBU1492576.1 NUDIX hydrolase [Actinomycetota bacterium]